MGLTRIQALLDGRPCLVLGSAPLTAEPRLGRGERLVVVNGAVSSTRRRPDVWVVNSRTDPYPSWGPERIALNDTMLAQAAGRALDTVAFLIREDGADAVTRHRLDAQGTRYAHTVAISKSEREWIERYVGARTAATERAKEALSAGLFAVALALWAGAGPVRMEGFSWRAGYHYLPDRALPDDMRAHRGGDRIALRALTARYRTRLQHHLAGVTPRDGRAGA